MLKINRILSKKIKFPLSLRGAFPPVIARERSDRSNLNHSGFSLIELMVAVAILAMAIFGIFHAYSVGFMGMADARDRTVAVNYARESMEDFKNMDFNQVKSKPITPIPDTKFSRGTYVLNLEETEIDKVVTLKKVITQVRWMDRKGNIKTEKASTIIYNKPTTSEIDEPARIIIYAQPYYTILPSYAEGLDLYAEIKDENGNTVYGGDITFSIITIYDPNDPNDAPAGYIYNAGRIKSAPVDIGTESAPDGIAHVKFYPFTVEEGIPVDGIERIQASANLDSGVVTDTVNIRVTTGPVGILLVPEPEEDKLPAGAGNTSTINLIVVKADYETPIAYESPITLSADGPGTLSETTIASVPTEGTSFALASDGTPGIVEITASAPDLDMGYTEITFTGEPASILITQDKKSIYPGEDIGIKVTIVDVNNIQVEFSGTVTLEALIDGELTPYGVLGGISNSISLDFITDDDFRISTFKATLDAPVGETITIQANAGDLSGSTDIIILSSLTPKYLDLSVWPYSVNLDGGETSTTVKAKVYDDSGSEIVTTYKTPIIFVAKVGESTFGHFSDNNVIPIDGEVGEVEELILSSDDAAGTVTITASSGDLILRPEGGVEVVFYHFADHIELSAVPDTIEAGGHDTSIITATVCDSDGNRVANYGTNGETITLSTSLGIFPNSDEGDKSSITIDSFDEGQITVGLSSTLTGTAEVTAVSNDVNSVGYNVTVDFIGNIPSEISDPFNVINWDDYRISFDLNVSGSPLYLEKIKVEWDNSHAVLNDFKIYDKQEEEYLLDIKNIGLSSPYNKTIEEVITLTIEKEYTIYLHFGDVSDAQAKMKNNNLIVTFTDENGTEYPLSFKVP